MPVDTAIYVNRPSAFYISNRKLGERRLTVELHFLHEVQHSESSRETDVADESFLGSFSALLTDQSLNQSHLAQRPLV